MSSRSDPFRHAHAFYFFAFHPDHPLLATFSSSLRTHLENRLSAASQEITFFRPDESDPSRVTLATWKSGIGPVRHSFDAYLMCDPRLVAQLDHEIDVFLACGTPPR